MGMCMQTAYGQLFQISVVPSLVIQWVNAILRVCPSWSLTKDLQEFVPQAQLRKAFLDCVRSRQTARLQERCSFCSAERSLHLWFTQVWYKLFSELRKRYSRMNSLFVFCSLLKGLYYFRKMEWFFRGHKII